MTEKFTYEALPMRVVFEVGAIGQLADELEHLGLGKVLVLSTPGHRGLGDRAADLLGSRSVGVFSGAKMHVPVATARAATQAATDAGADSCVAILSLIHI